jgi:hypothetical protein
MMNFDNAVAINSELPMLAAFPAATETANTVDERIREQLFVEIVGAIDHLQNDQGSSLVRRTEVPQQDDVNGCVDLKARFAMVSDQQRSRSAVSYAEFQQEHNQQQQSSASFQNEQALNNKRKVADAHSASATGSSAPLEFEVAVTSIAQQQQSSFPNANVEFRYVNGDYLQFPTFYKRLRLDENANKVMLLANPTYLAPELVEQQQQQQEVYATAGESRPTAEQGQVNGYSVM